MLDDVVLEKLMNFWELIIRKSSEKVPSERNKKVLE